MDFPIQRNWLNMNFSSSLVEWLWLDCLSCILQIISICHSTWHSTNSQCKATHFPSLCWGRKRRHFHETRGWNGYHGPHHLQQLQEPMVCFDKIYKFHHYLLSYMGGTLDQYLNSLSSSAPLHLKKISHNMEKYSPHNF